MKKWLLLLILSSLSFAQTKINPSQIRAPSGTASVSQILSCAPSSTCVFAQPGVVPNAQTGTTYTVLATDRMKYVSFSNGSAIAVTLPQAGTSGFANNFVFVACDIGAGTATITPTTSTISSSNGSAYTSAAATLALTTGQCAWIYSNNTDYFAIVRSGLATPVSVANGGTGIASGTSGGIPYYSSTTTIASSGALAAGQFVLGGGAGSAPTTSFSVVPVANGGVLQDTSTGLGGFYGYYIYPVINASTATNQTATANQVYVHRFTLPWAQRVTKVAFQVNTAQAASNCNAGIYDASKNLLFDSGAQATTATGVKVKTGGTVTLNPGDYFQAFACDTTSVAIEAGPEGATTDGLRENVNSGSMGIAANALAAGALPATLGALSSPNTPNIPYLFFGN